MSMIILASSNKDKLNELISHQTSVSKERSYPLFQNLAQYYIKFQEQVFLLESRENVFKFIQKVRKEETR